MDRKALTSSTIIFFMPSIDSSSSNAKSNFWESGGCDQRDESDGSAQTYSLADRLVVGIMPNTEVGMVECFLAGDPLRGIKGQQLGQEIDREWVGVRIQSREGDSRLDGQRSDVILGLKNVAKEVRSARPSPCLDSLLETQHGGEYLRLGFQGSARSG